MAALGQRAESGGNDEKMVGASADKRPEVMVFRSLTDVRELTETDQLSGDDVLPDLAVSVATLFEE